MSMYWSSLFLIWNPNALHVFTKAIRAAVLVLSWSYYILVHYVSTKRVFVPVIWLRVGPLRNSTSLSQTDNSVILNSNPPRRRLGHWTNKMYSGSLKPHRFISWSSSLLSSISNLHHLYLFRVIWHIVIMLHHIFIFWVVLSSKYALNIMRYCSVLSNNKL